MLFDLTGRGRRRTVRVIYGGLALIFLLGFVGFGVGSFGGGGFFEALNGNENSGGSIDYQSRIKKDKQLAARQPDNAAAWSKLIHDTLLQAGTGQNFNATEGTFTPKAQPLLQQVQHAWQRYLALTPRHPSSDVANEVLRALGPTGLNDPTGALRAMKIVIASRPPSAGLYSELAVIAYRAKDKRLGEQAAKKALKLAPAGEKTVLENYLARAKADPNGEAETRAAAQQTLTVPATGGKGGAGTAAPPQGTTSAPSTTTGAPAGAKK